MAHACLLAKASPPPSPAKNKHDGHAHPQPRWNGGGGGGGGGGGMWGGKGGSVRGERSAEKDKKGLGSAGDDSGVLRSLGVALPFVLAAAGKAL